MKTFFQFCLTSLFLAIATHTLFGGQEELRKHLLVVYNKDFEGSEQLANYYAEKRDIPKERVFGIRCSTAEQIDRKSYEQTIRNPIEQYMLNRGWLKQEDTSVKIGISRINMQTASKNDVWAIVLMRGVPVKIGHDPERETREVITKEMFRTNAASVDSELATLPVEVKNLSGYITNPFTYPGYERSFDDFDSKRMILVTRLDGPSNDEVRRMIDETLLAENHRLAGMVCIDARGIKDAQNGYYMGDEWLRASAKLFQQEGFDVQMDDLQPLFADNLGWRQVAFYSGWYADKAQGFLFQPPRRFAPGAIAYHIHSFSAMNVRTTTEQWVGPMIHSGAAAVIGSVFEPYLILMPHPDILASYLLKGYTYAEAAYAAQPSLSWMITVIGDPLYRPFQVDLSTALNQARVTKIPERDSLELQLVRKNLLKAQIAPNGAAITQALIRADSSAAIWEGLGDILSTLPEKPTIDIGKAYRKSMSMAELPLDQIRCGLKLVNMYIANNQPNEAIGLLKVLQDKWPAESPQYGVTDLLNKMNGAAPAVNAAQTPPPTGQSPATTNLNTSTLTPPGPPKPPRPTRLH